MSDYSFHVAGIRVQPDLSGAAWFPDLKTLAVADLHFEKGTSFVRRGLHLPPYDTKATLGRLGDVAEKFQPERIIALGDSFHDGQGPARLDGDDVAAIQRLTRNTQWIWIFGNHDPAATRGIDDLGGVALEELCLGDLTFRHEPQGTCGEVAGHLHPGAAIRQRGRRIRRKCFVSDGASLILPAFGAYTGSLNVCDPAFREVFDGSFRAHIIGREEIYSMAQAKLVPDRTGP